MYYCNENFRDENNVTMQQILIITTQA